MIEPAPAARLKDRVILVTGAGGGLGRAASLAYAAAGAQVILHGRNEKKLNAVYDDITKAGWAEPAFLTLDFSTAGDADFDALAYAIRSEFGRLDGVLHSASHLETLSPLEQQTSAQWERTLKVNLIAAFALTRACLPLLKAAPDAAILMTSETHGHTPQAYWGAYAVAKAALETMVKIWAQELEMYPQLRINAIVPGPVDTPLRARTHPGEAKHALRGSASLMPDYIYWMSEQSRGKSGRIIELAANKALERGEEPET